jgi:hypothetical protein
MSMPTQTDRSNPPHLQLETGKEQAAALVRLLQDGFYLPDIPSGTSVREFLTRMLGLPAEYIRDRIQSLFLNGRPVDDYDKARVHDGSRLALSSALPGLVGATLRQGGLLASFRNTITYQETAAAGGGSSLIHVKLFNLIMDEMGPILLQKGVLVKASALRNFLEENQEIAKTSKRILLNANPIEASALLGNDFAEMSDLVRITVHIA